MGDEVAVTIEGRLKELKDTENKALLVGVFLRASVKEESFLHVEELERLCDTYGLVSVDKIISPLRKIDVGTFLGKGKVQEIKQRAKELDVNVIVFDEEISPQQQRNLEKELEILIVDRTELILGVFEKHAKTKEAKIQVELAKLRYQMPRLKRLWTHLSRQRTGGKSGGFLKGEGERQIEIDRRLLRGRIDKLNQDLKGIRKNRELQRKSRKKSEIPTFGIVGYTNAGKSTLLNALTDAGVLVEDKLFATLDTTTRKFTLPNKQNILLTDTVGFIRKLPHMLIAAFKSTLEEAIQNDILLHVIDASSIEAIDQARSTIEVLKELDIHQRPMISILNKVDLCQDKSMINKLRLTFSKTVVVSALEKTGFDALLEKMMQEISLLRKVLYLKIPQSNYALVSELMKKGKVFSSDYEGNDIFLEVEIPSSLEHKVEIYKQENR